MDKKRLLQDLIDGLTTAREGMKKKEAEDFIKLYFDTIQKNLLNDRIVKINGLGTFKLIEVGARGSVDVNTGQSVLIKEHLKLSFLPDASFKDTVNKPFADFEPVETTEKPVLAVIEQTEPEPKQKVVITTAVTEEKPASEPEKQTDIQLMLEELTEKEPLMKPEKPRRTLPTLVFVVAGILFLAGLTYWSIVSNQSAKKDMTEKLQLVEEYYDEDSVDITAASTSYESSDSLMSTTVVSTPEPPRNSAIQTPKKEEKPSQKTSAVTSIKKRTVPVSVVVGAGDRLTLIAQKFYGHKIFWVYIYLENKGSISNPNNVSAGTTLSLPDKHPTMMDPNNPDAIKKAEELQDRIIKQLQSSHSDQ